MSGQPTSTAISRSAVASVLLVVLVVVASALRFVSITKSPPGFYIDEAAISAQVICIRESGASLEGQWLPLFTPVLQGGYLTPSYLVPALAWTSVFGDSIASFRTLTAFASLLFIWGSFVLGFRVWRSKDAAWMCALAAAISPWVFQFARIAWDPSLAPMYLVWAFAFLWPRDGNGAHESFEFPRQARLRAREIGVATACGFLFAAAGYCYPPLRVQIAITLPFAMFGLIRWRVKETVVRSTLTRFAIIGVVGMTLAIPLVLKTLSGEMLARTRMLSVFNPEFVPQQNGEGPILAGLRLFFQNLGALLSPDYLILHGDPNLRHSTGLLGLWSWLDLLAVFVAALALLLVLMKTSALKPWRFEIAFVIIGYIAGLLPAALTWESNPHALRSFGAVVFLVLGAGGSLSLMWRHSLKSRSAVLGMAFASFLVFVNVYFVRYPHAASPWFDAPVVEIAEQLRAEGRLKDMDFELRKRGIDYDPLAVSYYRLSAGVSSCGLAK